MSDWIAEGQSTSSDTKDILEKYLMPECRPMAPEDPLPQPAGDSRATQPGFDRCASSTEHRLSTNTPTQERSPATAPSAQDTGTLTSTSVPTPLNVEEGQIKLSSPRPLRIPHLTGCTAIFIHGLDASSRPLLTGAHVPPAGYPMLVRQTALDALSAGRVERVEIHAPLAPLDEYSVMAKTIVSSSLKKRGSAPEIGGESYPWDPDVDEEWEFVAVVGSREMARRVHRVRGIVQDES